MRQIVRLGPDSEQVNRDLEPTRREALVAEHHPRRPRDRRRLLRAVAVARLLALTTIQHEIGASESGVAWVLTGYLLSAAIATPILGRLGDIFGKRRVLIGVLIALAVGTLLAAVASSLSMLVLGRVIQGAGGGVFPLAFGIIRDEFPREKVSQARSGSCSALLGLGGGLGVVLAGPIVDNAQLPLAVLAPAEIDHPRPARRDDRADRRSRPTERRGRINWAGAVLMSIGLGVALCGDQPGHHVGLGVGQRRSAPLRRRRARACRRLGSSTNGARKEPLVDMRMMAIRGVWTINLVAAMLGAGMFAAARADPAACAAAARDRRRRLRRSPSPKPAWALLLPMSPS